jgi:hypothetical protein
MAFAIRPSSAWIWAIGGCRGYAAMVAAHPEIPGMTDDTVREEGIAGHWVAQMLGQGYIVPEGYIAPNKVEVDEEMLEGAEMYLQELRYHGLPVYQEMTLPAPWIHKDCGGTPDAWSWDAANRILRVWDYKYGYRFVDAFENPQLAIYASAILDYLNSIGWVTLDGHSEMDITVELIVVQPRGYGHEPIRRWRVKAAMLRALWNTIREAAHEAMSPNPTLKAGEWCNDCPARHDCPAAIRASLASIDYSAKMQPVNMSPEAMGDALRRLRKAQQFIESMASGFEAQLLHAISNGHVDPNWTTDYGRSRTVYKEGGEERVIALAKYLKIEGVTKPVRAKTPKQIAQLIDPQLLAPHIETRPGAKKLVPFNERTIRKLLND